MCSKRGKIYGIGVGVGDPEDMTLRAARIIGESDVLVCPGKDLGKCRAYQIARQAVPGIERIPTIPLDFQMTRNQDVRNRNHQRAYEAVRELVLQGKTVSFLTIGDPSLYSTFSYVFDLAREDGVEVGVVSGISSLTACANRLGMTLCEGDEQLHVISCVEDLEGSLDLPGTKVLMKCGLRLPFVKEVLRRKAGISVCAVSRCGTAEERCYRSLDQIPDDAGYMLTIIVKAEA